MVLYFTLIFTSFSVRNYLREVITFSDFHSGILVYQMFIICRGYWMPAHTFNLRGWLIRKKKLIRQRERSLVHFLDEIPSKWSCLESPVEVTVDSKFTDLNSWSEVCVPVP